MSDSDCMEEFACVPMQFGNVPLRGGFCLRRSGPGPMHATVCVSAARRTRELVGRGARALLRSE